MCAYLCLFWYVCALCVIPMSLICQKKIFCIRHTNVFRYQHPTRAIHALDGRFNTWQVYLVTKIYHNQIAAAKAFPKFLICSVCLFSFTFAALSLIYSGAFHIYTHAHIEFLCISHSGPHIDLCMTVRLRSAFVIVNFSPNSHRTSKNFLFSVCSVQIRVNDQTTICAIIVGIKVNECGVCVTFALNEQAKKKKNH